MHFGSRATDVPEEDILAVNISIPMVQKDRGEQMNHYKWSSVFLLA